MEDTPWKAGAGIHTARTRPGITTTKELVGNEAHTEAVLSFPKSADVEKVKAGALDGTECRL